MSAETQTPGLICLSHLGWNFVWQRPQHILSRIAAHYPVLYVHEPRVGAPEGEPRLEVISAEGGVTAVQPIFPDLPEIRASWREVYSQLVQDLLLEQGWAREDGQAVVATRPIVTWFYTPIPEYMREVIPSQVVVYDVMDELANFKFAPPDLREREAALLEAADVVFTGGRSLYESRQGRHPNLHLYASGVEPEHFAQALQPETEVAPEIAELPHPILGYYGVIDERMDLDLLRAVAERRPEWTIVMVGPVVKIDPADLPRLPNIHYPGQQPYARLPNFLKGFDICLMPFAINEATRFISPTKALEYMAARRPIVSTPVHDVVANWSHIVYVADGADAFIDAVERALAEDEEQRGKRARAEDEILNRNTWDHIAGEIRGHIGAVLERGATPAPARRASWRGARQLA